MPSFTGPYPSESAKTKAVFPLSNRISGTGWGAQLLCDDNNVLSISILSPANAPIGRYTLSIEIDLSSALNPVDHLTLLHALLFAL